MNQDKFNEKLVWTLTKMLVAINTSEPAQSIIGADIEELAEIVNEMRMGSVKIK